MINLKTTAYSQFFSFSWLYGITTGSMASISQLIKLIDTYHTYISSLYGRWVLNISQQYKYIHVRLPHSVLLCTRKAVLIVCVDSPQHTRSPRGIWKDVFGSGLWRTSSFTTKFVLHFLNVRQLFLWFYYLLKMFSLPAVLK